MNTEAFGTTVFCDDIRYEENGKLTLVGCYGAELIFNNPAPGILTAFSALINIRVPKSISFKTVSLRVYKEEGSEVSDLFRTDMNLPDRDTEKTTPVLNTEKTGDTVVAITVPLHLPPLQITEPGFIKVRARLDGGPEIKLGALKVVFQERASGSSDG